MKWPPPKSVPRPSYEYSRDGQVWRALAADDIDQLFTFLLANPFTGRRVTRLYDRLKAGEVVQVFPGRSFAVHLREVGCP